MTVAIVNRLQPNIFSALSYNDQNIPWEKNMRFDLPGWGWFDNA